ncbi:MAG: DUF6701 domain-containing protein, partial [Pseudomonadota bacterium]
ALTLDLLDAFTYQRGAGAEIAPYTVSAAIAVDDIQEMTDSIAISGGPVSVTPAGFEQRYGRLRLSNVFGPETTTLDVPAEVQYLGAGGIYQQNQDDGCTAFATVTTLPDSSPSGSHLDIPVNAGTSDLTFTSPVVGGTLSMQLSSPNAGNSGSVDITVDMSAVPWLQYDWNGDSSVDTTQTGQALFGQYRGHDRMVYWYER